MRPHLQTVTCTVICWLYVGYTFVFHQFKRVFHIRLHNVPLKNFILVNMLSRYELDPTFHYAWISLPILPNKFNLVNTYCKIGALLSLSISKSVVQIFIGWLNLEVAISSFEHLKSFRLANSFSSRPVHVNLPSTRFVGKNFFSLRNVAGAFDTVEWPNLKYVATFLWDVGNGA